MPTPPHQLLSDATYDHIGYAVRDLDAAVAYTQDVFGLELKRSFNAPELGMSGSFFGLGTQQFEVLTFHDPQVLDARIGDRERRLDHIAVRVPNLEELGQRLKADGMRFQMPASFEELNEPFELAGRWHLWTQPATSGGLMWQLIQG